MNNKSYSNKSISFTTSSSQKSEVIEALQKWLDAYKLSVSDELANTFYLNVHLQENTRSEKTGSPYISYNEVMSDNSIACATPNTYS